MPNYIKTIISIDVETDGSIPAINSMRQLGAVAFDLYGRPLDSFSVNLAPLTGAVQDKRTMRWWKSWPKQWKAVNQDLKDPKLAIEKYARWMSRFPRPKMLAAPVAFDGMWVRWYLERFVTQHRPLQWHNMIDLRSVLFAYTGQYKGDYRANIVALTGTQPKPNPNPHDAVSDAMEQGLIFFALLKWAKANGRYNLVEGSPAPGKVR